MDKKRMLATVCLAVFLVSLIPIAGIARYSRPCADDYSYSLQTHTYVAGGGKNALSLLEEAWKTNMQFYKTWQGLYTSAFLLSLQPGIFGEQYYCIGAWFLMLLMFFCLFYFIDTVECLLGVKKYRWMIATAILAIVLCGMPSIVQGLYWFNGAWNYTPFFFLTLVNISIVLRMCVQEKKKYRIPAALFSFLISGGNHVTGFLNILLLMILSVTFGRRRRDVFIPLTAAILGFLFMYFAPGTRIRQEKLLQQGFFETILASAWGCYVYICKWINVQWVFVLVLSTPLALALSRKTHPDTRMFLRHPLVLLVMSIMTLCGVLCVPYYAMGSFGDGRLTNVIWLCFLFLSVGNWVYFVIWSTHRFAIRFERSFRWIGGASLAVVCLATVFFRASNSLLAGRELYDGTAQNYAAACDSRYEAMRNSSGEKTIFSPLPRSECLRFSDLTGDESDWRNKAWAEYYGVVVVVR